MNHPRSAVKGSSRSATFMGWRLALGLRTASPHCAVMRLPSLPKGTEALGKRAVLETLLTGPRLLRACLTRRVLCQ